MQVILNDLQFKTVANILITYLGSYLLPGSICKEIAIFEGLNIAKIVLMSIWCFYCAQVRHHLSGICLSLSPPMSVQRCKYRQSLNFVVLILQVTRYESKA